MGSFDDIINRHIKEVLLNQKQHIKSRLVLVLAESNLDKRITDSLGKNQDLVLNEADIHALRRIFNEIKEL